MLIALVTALAAVLGQTIIKFAFNRPRFRSLSDPDTQFTYWFVHHPFAMDSSFPSGHAAQSALAFLLLYLKRFIPGLRSRRWDALFGAAAAFITGSTMLSRMFLGAHYATDVWAGCFLTLGTISAAHWFVDSTYMLPRYRLRAIREKAGRLCVIAGTEAARVQYGLLVRKLDADALLADPLLPRRERSLLRTVRRLDNRFIREIRLKNYEDIYSVPEK